ncbi:hypothetical protein ACFO4O_14580 [Glaciecola siphonariae]|uniref:Lipid/polyisoprenoid-binding YceI-like domain-containing protein n=1 Tax=Glaciecola siphonariae TaxID=521012 RepID=A0ABV9LY22_9ALTE
MRAGFLKVLLAILLFFSYQNVFAKITIEGSWECDYGYSYEAYELSQNLRLDFDGAANLYSIRGVVTISPSDSNKSSLHYDSLVRYSLVDKKMHSETVEFKVERMEDPNGFFDQATIDAMSNMSSNSAIEFTASGGLSFQYEDGLLFECRRPIAK